MSAHTVTATLGFADFRQEFAAADDARLCVLRLLADGWLDVELDGVRWTLGPVVTA